MTDQEQCTAALREKLTELAKSEEEWRSVFANAPIFVAIVDRAGTIRFLNRTQPGYSFEEAVGKRIFDFIAPEYHDVAKACLERVFRTGNTASYETIAAGPAGASAWYETHLGPVKHGDETVAASLFSTDITARKEAEESLQEVRETLEQRVERRAAEVVAANKQVKRQIESLRQNHEELQAIYDGMVDGLLIADVETKNFLRANQAICAMLGYSEEEILARSVTDIHPPDALADVLEKFKKQANGQLTVAENLPVLRKDGTVFYADITTNRVFYKGRPCAIGFFRDITERRESHEALRKEHRVLDQLLKAQDRERQVIAYEIHDGLAQQLTAAIMLFQTIDRKNQQASEAFDAVQALLSQSLAEARRLISGVRPPILDEYGVVPAIEYLASERVGEANVEVSVRCAVAFDRLAPVLENAIYRIVQESLSNARRHSKSDKVQVDVVQNHDRVRIVIQDWGIGFDPQNVDEKCFGLMGIRERARLLGGSADIDARPGEGSRVVVELPVAAGKLSG